MYVIICAVRSLFLFFYVRWNRKNRGVPVNNTRIDMDYRTGYIRSHLRSPSGRVR